MQKFVVVVLKCPSLPRFTHRNFKWEAAALYRCHLTAAATYGEQLCSSSSHHKAAILFLALASESASVRCQLGDTPSKTGKWGGWNADGAFPLL